LKTVAVCPICKNFLSNNLFRDDGSDRDDCLQPFVLAKKYLMARGYAMDTIDIADFKEAGCILFYDFNVRLILKAFLAGKSTIYIQLEPPCVYPFHQPKVLRKLQSIFTAVITWDDGLVDGGRFIKYHIPMPYPRQNTPAVDFNDKKLLTNISGNKSSFHKDELYSKRVEAIRYFEANAPDGFDLYGFGWDGAEYPSYRGTVANKNETLRNYRFTLCYENMTNIDGYISEKIFDAFYAGCVPIYWGADNIADYVDPRCYIDKRDFGSYGELHDYLRDMSEDEYNARLHAIAEYLASDSYKPFLPEGFAQTLFEAVNSLDGLRVRGVGFAASLTAYGFYFLYYKAKRHFRKLFRMERRDFL
jgi:hypothetical protein